VAEHPARPCLFLLGGLKISDAFGMMRKVLAEGIADEVLTAGITGQIMLMAGGIRLGEPSERFIADRSLDAFVPEAVALLEQFPEHIRVPRDVAYDQDGTRREMAVADLPAPAAIVDIGEATIEAYRQSIAGAATIFVNGPAGVYESAVGDRGTRELWTAVAGAGGVSVIGGGDTVASARRFVDLDHIGFVSTGGGALIRYLSGQRLPLLEAMRRAAERPAVL
jgi:phosphoglycerate kinase